MTIDKVERRSMANLTPEQIERKIAALAKKRDHAADVLNKPILAWTYQQEIDALTQETKE
jgi:hypothetical protein